MLAQTVQIITEHTNSSGAFTYREWTFFGIIAIIFILWKTVGKKI